MRRKFPRPRGVAVLLPRPRKQPLPAHKESVKKNHKYFIPLDFKGRYLWCDNFRTKLQPLLERYGIDPEDYDLLDTCTRQLGILNERLDRLAALHKGTTQYRQDFWRSPTPDLREVPADASILPPLAPLPMDFVNLIRRLVRQIQASPYYNESDAKSLGLIGPAVGTDLDTSKPWPRFVLSGGHVRITYEKHYTFSGVRLWADHGTGDLQFFGVFTAATFIDPTPLPGTPQRWIYQCQYLLGDTLVGQPSDTHEIVVSDKPVD